MPDQPQIVIVQILQQNGIRLGANVIAEALKLAGED